MIHNCEKINNCISAVRTAARHKNTQMEIFLQSVEPPLEGKQNQKNCQKIFEFILNSYTWLRTED